MKKPTRRNASKALCAYFTSGNRSGQMGIVEGKRLGVCVKDSGSWADQSIFQKQSVLKY